MANGHIAIDINWYDKVKTIIYLGDLLTNQNSIQEEIKCKLRVGNVDLGGLRVPCSPRDPRFAGSNPAEVDGLFQDVKILSTGPSGGTLSWGSRV